MIITFIELRCALVNAWGVDMLIFIVYPPRIGQCVPKFAQVVYAYQFHHARITKSNQNLILRSHALAVLWIIEYSGFSKRIMNSKRANYGKNQTFN